MSISILLFLTGPTFGLSDLQEFELLAEVVFSILTKVFIIGAVIIAVVYIFRVLIDKSYSIRQINVPASFEQAGHSGPVVANRIYYRIQQIIQRVSATEFSKRYSTSATETDVSVDLAGMGLPLKAFVETLGNALGIHRGKKIDADIFLEKNMVVMLLRITGHNAERFEAPMNDAIDVPLKALILEAAENILKYSNDEVLQTYYGLVEQISDKQIRLAKYRLEIYKDKPAMLVNAVAALVWGLCMVKKYDEAEEKIKEEIPKFKKPGRIYVIWGTLLMQVGKCEEAIEKLLLAIKYTAKNESKYRKANILVTIGRSLSRLGRQDEAIEYFQKAIRMDENSHGAYFNLAKEHLRLNHAAELIHELLEKGLARGLKVKAVLNDPDCKLMLDDPSLKKLLEKYLEEG